MKERTHCRHPRRPSALAVLALLAIAAMSSTTTEAKAQATTAKTSPVHVAPVEARTAHFHRGLTLSLTTTTATATTTTTTTTAPHRIVSLSPAVTETLFAIGAGGQVVGVTRFCDRPTAAKALPNIGGYTDASLEAIMALKPDLVIAQPSFGQRAILDALVRAHIPVWVVFADTVDESRAMMVAVAEVSGHPGAASLLVARLDDALSMTTAAMTAAGMAEGSSLGVVVVVGQDPIVVAGRHSFPDDALRAVLAANGDGRHPTSVVTDSDPQWPVWSLESLLSRRVHLVVAAEGPEAAKALAIRLAPLGRRTPRIVSADRAILMRPGPSFADDVDTLRTLLASEAPTKP